MGTGQWEGQGSRAFPPAYELVWMRAGLEHSILTSRKPSVIILQCAMMNNK